MIKKVAHFKLQDTKAKYYPPLSPFLWGSKDGYFFLSFQAKRGNLFFTHILILIISLFTVHYSLLTSSCFAEEKTIITSDTLEYIKETSTYIAHGNVTIQQNDTVIEADQIHYNEQTGEILATGKVRLNDKNVSITAIKAELNLDKKTGRLYEAEIFYKKDNYHISGKEIEKLGPDHYYSLQASFTTCDAPVPAWCFKGKNIDAVVGDALTATDVSFRIKDVPVFYTPYLWAPVLTERKTGLLIPNISYSNLRGLLFGIPFYWAITENRDATISLDMYTKRGIGEGLQYRYVELNDIKGDWWLYHIRDRELHKDFFELRGTHEQRSTEKIGGFLNINYINERDFYREFSPQLEIRTNRFFESTGEISLPLKYSRMYMLSQYWIDLKEKNESIPQKLPEAGYVLNPLKIGSFWITTDIAASNFWRDEGAYGQRFDIYPKILHTFGNDIVVSQTLGLRETAYSLQDSENDEENPHRESLEYSIKANARLLKRYGHFSHIIEPTIGYTLITNSEENLPLLDSAELYKKVSLIELSLLNRLLNHHGEFLVIRATQGFDSYQGDRPFQPFRLEVGVRMPVSLRLEAAYDVHMGRLESINSDILTNIFGVNVSASQRYNRQDEITYYNAGIGVHPLKSLYLDGRIWYDAEGKKTKDITVNIKYLHQCWGLNLQFIKRPGDFTTSIMIELKGITKPLRI